MDKNQPNIVGNGPQRRFISSTFERVEGEDSNPLQIRGHGSVFNVMSEDLGGFREVIHKGAFDKALINSDIRCLFNHNPDFPLGRVSAGNLSVSTDEIGLAYTCDMIDTYTARDLKKNIDAKIVTQSSFAFTQDWEDESGKKWEFERTASGEWILHHYEVSELFDVSPVTYPAYKAAGVRSALPALERAKESFETRKAEQEAQEKEKIEAQERAEQQVLTGPAVYRQRQIEINTNLIQPAGNLPKKFIMKSEKELLEERARIIGQQTDLNNRSVGRQLTDDENAQWDAMQVDVARLTSEIQRNRSVKENMALLEERKNEAAGHRVPADTEVSSEGGGSPTYRKAFDSWIRKGVGGMSAESRAVLMRGTNPQTTATDSLGGFTVPEEFSNELIKAMAYYGGMLDVTNVIRTASGGAMPFPYIDETAVTGSLVAENGAIPVSDMTFSSKTLNAYMYSAGIVKLSFQLIQDNGVNLESEIIPILADRLGRIINLHLTTGDGSGKPTGVVTSASAGVTTTATAAITRGEIIDLQHSLDIAYRANARYMMNDLTISAIRKLALGSGDASPLWQPSMREGAPDLLEGKPYTINNDMASLGAGNVPILFGDFSKYRTRMVRDVTMVEMNELYVANLQKGMTAFARVDGALLDAKSVKKMTNAAS